jgi:hypothetical protein
VNRELLFKQRKKNNNNTKKNKTRKKRRRRRRKKRKKKKTKRDTIRFGTTPLRLITTNKNNCLPINLSRSIVSSPNSLMVCLYSYIIDERSI